MDSYLISYDLIGPNRDYEAIIEKIKTYPDWARPLESVWIIKTSESHKSIRDKLITTMDSNDKLLVVKLSGTAAWKNLSSDISKWLKDNL